MNPIAKSSDSADFEATLRLIARLSAPEGLEERVQASLRVAPASGKARMLAWPMARRLDNAWMRSAAAAAIVAVVAGGSWGIYSRVQPAQPSRAITAPPRVSTQGGFSSAGAMRTPQTLNGPMVVEHPAAALPALPARPAGKPPLKTPNQSGKTVQAIKAVRQPVAPPAR